MLTPSHGLIAWLVGRRLFQSQPEMVKFLVLGSVFADLLMIVCGLYWFLTRGRHPWDIYLDIFIPFWVSYPTRLLHSFIFILPLFILLITLWRHLLKLRLLVLSWLTFHVGIDLITHEQYGHEHFWPVSDYKFIGFTSDENIYFFVLDCALSTAAIFILLVKVIQNLHQKNKRIGQVNRQ